MLTPPKVTQVGQREEDNNNKKPQKVTFGVKRLRGSEVDIRAEE